eukprot:CAMPEP_0198218390 /NCGR_PEP_ID=MMETSP1445-20131203/68955_1 /TAXON_ID=36898 /ORGANISM="Pyramimonas sp., Strain CCMP2087" /LENGTH=208 /DNA_ID=CAMNT_0043895393 /DNA_START=8 /DNA_END=631 /DNA_ORIENTATION=+
MALSLKAVGAGLKGTSRLEVPSLATTVKELKEIIALRLGVADTSCINVISGGRNLQEDSKRLEEYGLSSTSRLLVTLTSTSSAERLHAEEANAKVQEDRTSRLNRLKCAAEAMARRGKGSTLDSYMPVLEDQNGNAVQFLSQEDKYALVTGLVLHASGQASMDKADFQEALDTFTMGEEAFKLCDPSHLSMIDNAGLLQLDIVWCIFK